jgi:antitoxin component of MazEF toxin-antitoxin module
VAGALLATTAAAPLPAQAAKAAKGMKNPKVKVEKESRAVLLARAKEERLAELKAKAAAAREGGKVTVGY